MHEDRIQVTHPEKLLFPDVGLTKADVIRYYRLVSARMLPQMLRRPVAFKRYPEGVQGEGFLQRQVPSWYPAWVKRIEVKTQAGTHEQLLCDDEETLVLLAEQDAIELHCWLARAPLLDQAERLVLDMDPSATTPTSAIRAVVEDARALLTRLGLSPYLMTTGSRGYHVVVPLAPGAPAGAVHVFARNLAEALTSLEPAARTITPSKAARGEKLFIDYLRNGYAQLSVAPYSLRAHPEAPVAMPIAWDDLDRTPPRAWRAAAILVNGLPEEDPWARFEDARAPLEPARERLATLLR